MNKKLKISINYGKQTPVCKLSVKKCCFLTFLMQKSPVLAVLVKGLFTR